MRHKKKRFSNYVRWDFEIEHGGYKVDIVVKDNIRQYTDSYFSAYWSTPTMRSSQWHIHMARYRSRDQEHRKAARQEIFARLRLSLNYGLNVKGRAVVDRLMGSTGQYIPHVKKQVSGKF